MCGRIFSASCTELGKWVNYSVFEIVKASRTFKSTSLCLASISSFLLRKSNSFLSKSSILLIANVTICYSGFGRSRSNRSSLRSFYRSPLLINLNIFPLVFENVRPGRSVNRVKCLTTDKFNIGKRNLLPRLSTVTQHIFKLLISNTVKFVKIS